MLQYVNHWFYYYMWQCSYDDKYYRFAKDLILDKFNKLMIELESRLVWHEGGPSRKRGYLAKFLLK